jgi:hypothetical protein
MFYFLFVCSFFGAIIRKNIGVRVSIHIQNQFDFLNFFANCIHNTIVDIIHNIHVAKNVNQTIKFTIPTINIEEFADILVISIFHSMIINGDIIHQNNHFFQKTLHRINKFRIGIIDSRHFLPSFSNILHKYTILNRDHIQMII